MTESLSKQQARKLVLLSQKLPPKKLSGPAISATLSTIEHLGYIQIDSLSVIQRAHHHTLWSRFPRYNNNHLEQLLKEKEIFEYWSHAAAYLPMSDYRFSLPRKQAIARGDENHWYTRDKKLRKAALQRIKNEGPLMAKDFESDGHKTYEWTRKPAKRALENLYMQGELMIPFRHNFHKVYDLTERVLPQGVNTSIPSKEEYARFLIIRYLQTNGIGQIGEITYLRKNLKELITATIQEMRVSGELLLVKVGKTLYYALPKSLELLSKHLRYRTLKILSPFDNLLIQRKRTQTLFDFEYKLECYTPKAKRQYGYFALPVLWDGKLVARIDCKAERKTAILHILNMVLEPSLLKIDDFMHALIKELPSFLKFNSCRSVRLHTASPEKVQPLIQTALQIFKE
jgi:uncharacterized protein